MEPLLFSQDICISRFIPRECRVLEMWTCRKVSRVTLLHLLVHWSPAWPLPKQPPTVCMKDLMPLHTVLGQPTPTRTKSRSWSQIQPPPLLFPATDYQSFLQPTQTPPTNMFMPASQAPLASWQFPIKSESASGSQWYFAQIWAECCRPRQIEELVY